MNSIFWEIIISDLNLLDAIERISNKGSENETIITRSGQIICKYATKKELNYKYKKEIDNQTIN